MVLRQIQNRSLSDQVFEQLVSEIMANHYPPGAALPAERALAAALAVNRHVVREAIRRLEQIGMVRVAQGGSTIVLDYRTHGGLDMLSLLATHAHGADSARFWLAVLELRAVIGGEVAHQCARRAEPALRQELVAISDQMRAQKDGDDDALYQLDARFWERVLDGADNLVCRLALNNLVKVSGAMGGPARRAYADEARRADFRRPIAQAISSGDAIAAEQLTRDSLRRMVEAFESQSIASGRAQATRRTSDLPATRSRE